MKKTIFLLSVLFGAFIMGCTAEKEKSVEITTAETEATHDDENLNLEDYDRFGDSIVADAWLTSEKMNAYYSEMQTGDSMEVTFRGTVNSVCQKKGCWIKLALSEENESFVRFKDYGFFVPKDAEGADVIVHGTAYKEEISVEELQHYAEDAGESEEEINAITEPEVKYTFMANGVLLKKS